MTVLVKAAVESECLPSARPVSRDGHMLFRIFVRPIGS